VLCALCAGSGAAAPQLRHRSAAWLAAGSRPSVLPGPVLIADRGNNRLLMIDPDGRVIWKFPQVEDLRPGQTFVSPDDAFFSEDGKQIIVTQENDSVLSIVDIATRRIVHQYGTPGVPGGGPNHLSNPDDAMLLPGGWIIVPDIKNCRLLLIRVGAHRPSRIIGTTTQACYHAPPRHWGSPNGAFPMRNGHFLVTEINGDWIDELTLAGNVVRSLHPPGFTYPSDTNEVRPGLYVSVDYTTPGGLEKFDRNGHIRWHYQPRGADPQPDHPSLAMPRSNGDVLLTDDNNDRVIVIDPRTDRVVWQYGHTRSAGRSPGYVSDPDGLDLAPPNSLLIVHRATIGRP
jgi:outer membrane protein assembly factor BamB